MINKKFLCVLAGFVLLVSCDEKEATTENQFFVKEEKETVKDEFTAISDSLENNPENIELWIKQGQICKENLNFKCALNAGAKAYRIDSTNIEARQLYAWTLINKPNTPNSDIQRAKRHYQY